MASRIHAELVVVRATDDVVLVGRIHRDRGLVAWTALFAIGIDVRRRLSGRRADAVAGFQRRAAAEYGACDGRRRVANGVGDVDREVAFSLLLTKHDTHAG